MPLPQEFIDRIRDYSDIVELIGQYVSLKKRGANYLGLCPFHSEKTPSFSVNPAKGIYKCFGCGVGGNVFTFIMQREKMLFPEAVEFLARRLGIEPPKTYTPEQQSRREKLFAAAQKGQHFFRESYKRSRTAQDYILNRKFSPEIIEKMELGYAPDSWDAFTKTIQSNHKDYAAIGLLRSREGGGYYDYFRSRLMFPIKDLSGRVCAFGGRDLSGADDTAKYLNSPENPIYSKGSLLYGIADTRDAIRDAGFAYLVEGNTDFLRLIDSGIGNCAAGLGTAFTPQQTKLLRRYAGEVIVLYDGDEAGCKAALRTSRILLSEGLQVRVIALPPEHDPDSYLLEYGKEGITQAAALSVLKFQLKTFGGLPESRQEREALAHAMLGTVKVMDSEMKRSLALEEMSELLSIPYQPLAAELKNWKYREETIEDETVQNQALEFKPADIPERDLIRLLIANPQSGEDVFTTLDAGLISNEHLQSIFTTMKSFFLKGELTSSHALLNNFEDPLIQNFIAECLLWEPPADVELLIKHGQEKIENMYLKREKAAILQAIKKTQANGKDTHELRKHLQTINRRKQS